MNRVLELQQRRAKLLEDIKAIPALAATEQRAMTSEENEKFNKMCDDEAALRNTIEAERKVAEFAKESDQSRETRERAAAGGDKQQTEADKYEAAFRSYLLNDQMDIPEEHRSLLRRGYQAVDSKEFRDQGISTGAGGGYTIPVSFQNELITAMKWFGGMRTAATRKIRTASGNDLQWPLMDDTGNVGALLSENTAVTTQDVSFNQVTFRGYKYTSKMIKVSRELLMDSAVNVPSEIGMRLGERLGRISNTHFTVGDNINKPQGIVNGAFLGVTAATGGTTTVSYNDLQELKFSVDKAYRDNPSAQFMLHDSTWKAILKLTDSYGRPIIQSTTQGVSTEFPDSLLGKPVIVNNDIPVMAANAKSILYGDMSYYLIRDVLDVTMVRLNERYAEYDQIAFVAFMRMDGRILDGGTHPIKYYQNSAS